MSSRDRKDINEQVECLSSGIILLSKAIVQNQTESRSIAKATWETLSRREKPVFINSLRSDGYTQSEVGEIVGLSQSAIAQYEKKYKHQK